MKLLLNLLETIRNNNKRSDEQSVFEHINKTSATNIDQKYITSVIEVMLNKNLIYDKS